MSRPSRPLSTAGGSGWRNTAWAGFSKVKDYVASSEVSKSAYNAVSNRVVAYRTGIDPTTGEKRQTWEEWARERRKRRWEEQRGSERIALFPGWATRRCVDAKPFGKGDEVQQFTLDVFVSGFAFSLRSPEQATRSQRAFMRIARGFSALPRLPPPPENILSGLGSTTPLRQSPNPSVDDLTEELARMGVVLPPRPDEMTQETETQILRTPTHKISQAGDSRVVDYGATSTQPGASPYTSRSGNGYSRMPGGTSRSSPGTSRHERTNTEDSTSSIFSSNSTTGSTDVSSIHSEMDTGILRQLHANLDARLQPFWSSKLEDRIVRIAVYVASPDSDNSSGRNRSQDQMPLVSIKVRTGTQGYFSHRFSLSFEQLCTHDQALHIAFGRHHEEHPLFVRAELLPVLQGGESGSGATGDISVLKERPKQVIETVRVQGELQLSSARIRVISDIDDTVKISEVLMGVRAIFHNVFVRHLDELVVPGMPEFYAKLAARGARFHYVSNGPFELLPVLLDFFGVAGLPKGSVKLKSYGGRNIFQGLWGESAADRKRGNVVDILDSFPESKFILIGDTGEQDLELYSALAQERPHQIVALFLRDVTPATPPPTAPPSPALGPIPDRRVKQQSSTSSLRSIPSRVGAAKKRKEELPKIRIPRPSQDSTDSGQFRFTPRSLTDPSRTSNPPTPYKAYTPRARGSSGSYFDSATPVAKRTEPPSVPGQFTSLDFGMDPASALVSAAATAGTGHSTDVVTDNTRAGILAKKEALRLRTEAARAQVPSHITLKVFKEPGECEDEAMRLLDVLEGRNRNHWSTDEELLL